MLKKMMILTDCDTKKAFVKKLSVAATVIFFILAVCAFSVLTSVTKVTVFDGEKSEAIYTLSADPVSVLKTAKLKSSEYTITAVDKSDRNTTIRLRYTFPVFVTCGKETKQVTFMSGDTVSKALKLADVKLDKYDIVNLPLTDKLYETTYIDVTDIDYITKTKTEQIAFTKKTVYSASTSVSKVTTKGVNGERTVKTITKIVNGAEESTSVLSEEITKQPVQQIYTIGTKKPKGTISQLNAIVELNEKGEPIHYKKHVVAQATAYANDPSSATGVKLKPGYVAINPKVYPYGTKFYIKSSDGKYIYGYAVAADTGGFIKTRPTGFDLYFATEEECNKFGRRNIEVWILE